MPRYPRLGHVLGWIAPVATTAAVLWLASPPPQEPSLRDCMMGVKSNLSGLAGSVRSPESDARTLEFAANCQTYLLRAKLMDPPGLDELPEEERDAHRRAFRADLARAVTEFLALEIDVLEGRRDEAFERIRGPLFRLREAAHERFQRE